LEPFEPNKYKELAIFYIDVGYWWIGYDVASCLADANENYSAEADEQDCYQLGDADLDKLKFYDEESGETHSFREQFEIEKRIGGEFPRHFAAEDW
jgi:hypothetical protein